MSFFIKRLYRPPPAGQNVRPWPPNPLLINKTSHLAIKHKPHFELRTLECIKISHEGSHKRLCRFGSQRTTARSVMDKAVKRGDAQSWIDMRGALIGSRVNKSSSEINPMRRKTWRLMWAGSRWNKNIYEEDCSRSWGAGCCKVKHTALLHWRGSLLFITM